MDFISNKEEQQQLMLKQIGIERIEELFVGVPSELRVAAPSQNDGLSEWEGMELIRKIGKKNRAHNFECYLGAGAYHHHVPALVHAITSRSEFLTAYTPYQAEASQGILQAIFEFQSAVCALTGLEVANASVYDGASACAEALLMALRAKKGRNRVVITESLHPHYRAVIDQYLSQAEIVTVSTQNGVLDLEEVATFFNSDTAAVLLPYPGFFGTIDKIDTCFAAAHAVGAVSIVCANPLVWGLMRSAADLGADIAVGDLQPLGLPLSFGGPYAGYMACSQEFMRQIPGRIVGETVDSAGNRGFVLTLQTREQHIRREKATSNICSNQNLAAIASLVTLLWYGPQGLRKLALTNYQRAAYLRERLCSLPGVEPVNQAPHFNEFAVRLPIAAEKVCEGLEAQGILAGLPLGRFFSGHDKSLLVAVTETKNREQLDRYVSCVEELL